jgi:hypothetical protein
MVRHRQEPPYFPYDLTAAIDTDISRFLKDILQVRPLGRGWITRTIQARQVSLASRALEPCRAC